MNGRCEMDVFDLYFTNKNNAIYNATIDPIKAFNKSFEQDGEIVERVLETVEDTLGSYCLGVCRPFYDNDKPCYKTDKCGVVNCLFK